VFSCACGQQYSVAESLAGKSGRCKKCGATMVIPQPPPVEVAEVEVVVEKEATYAPTDERPKEEDAEPVAEADEADAPRWFQGYVAPRGAPRAGGVYRVGDELGCRDGGPRVAGNPHAAATTGAAAGGLVGALVGLAAGAIARKIGERQKEEAKRRQKQLDAMSDEALLKEADSGRPNQRWRLADVNETALLKPSLWNGVQVLAVLHLQTTGAGKSARTAIYFDRLKELKAAAALLREALGKENVTVKVPLTRKGVAKAEARMLRTHRIVQWSLAAAAVVLFLVLLIPLFFRGKP